MTKQEANQYMSAILTTAAEVEPAPIPESAAYMVMGMNLPKWETIKSVLLRAGLMVSVNHGMTLTDAGRDMAAKIEAFRLAHA